MPHPQSLIDPRSSVTYRRVSSRKQAEHGYSLEDQASVCQQYAATAGLHIVEDFCEGGVSGAKVSRPQFDAMLTYIGKHRIGNVIIAHGDRHARGGGAGGLVRFLIQQAGATLHLTGIGAITDDDDSQTQAELSEFVGGLERRLIVKRTTAGRLRAAQDGKLACGGAPYGYRRAQDGKLTKYEPEAAIVHRIFQSYADGLSLKAIAEQFSAERIPTPRAAHKPKRDATAWGTSTLVKILRATTYRGAWLYRSRTAGDVPVPCPAIVSDDLWNAAQAARVNHARAAKRNRKREYLLSGLRARCAVCGGALSPHTNRVGTVYYQCAGGQRHRSRNGVDVTCQDGALRGDRFEDLVWSENEKFISDPAKLETYTEEITAKREAASAALRARLAVYDKRIADLNARRNREMDVYSDPDSKADKAWLNARIEAIQEELSEDEQRRAKLLREIEEAHTADPLERRIRVGLWSQLAPLLEQRQLRPGIDGADVARAIADCAVSVSDAMRAAKELVQAGDTPESRRAWIERLNVRVEVDRPADTALLRIGDLAPALIEMGLIASTIS